MKFGLTEATITKINQVFKNHSEIDRAVLYGSRAKGNYKLGSDIDLTLYGDGLSYELLGKLLDELDDVLLPYTFDLSIFKKIDNENLCDHIERVGLVFYEREVSSKQDWEVKRLGEVCEFFNGQAHEKFIAENGQYILVNSKFISTEGMIFKTTDKALSPLNENDIVFVMSDVPNGKALAKCYIIDKNDKYTLNQRIGLIRSKNYNVKYLYYQLNRHKFLLEFNNGENQTNLRKNDILNCPLILPPLPEQHRIVAILDQAFAAIEKAKANAEKNLHNAKALFESYLQNIFEAKGDGWEEKTLGEVCEYEKSNYKGNSLPYVGLEDIQSNTGKLIGSLTPRTMQSLTFEFNNTHVLYGRLRPYLNKVLLPNFDGHCSTEIFPIKPNEKLISRNFLFHWLISNTTMNKINATWSGATLPRANMNKVLEFKINLPPLPEQTHMVKKLDALSAETKKLEILYQKKIADLEELKKSILNKAFNGELHPHPNPPPRVRRGGDKNST